LVKAADLVAASIRGAGEVAFAKWLRETIGCLEIAHDELVTAIDALSTPILTTNYDTLVEQISGRGSVSWRDPSGLQSVLMRSDKRVAHLHGVWQDPQSIVLTESDYNRILADEPSQHLQRAAGALTPLVFVGYGAGLED